MQIGKPAPARSGYVTPSLARPAIASGLARDVAQFSSLASSAAGRAEASVKSGFSSLASSALDLVSSGSNKLYDALHASSVGRAAFVVLEKTMGAVFNFQDRHLDANVAPPPAGLASDPVGEPLPAPAHPLPQLATRGNQIVDARSGKPVRLRGVDMSGFEYKKTGDQQDPQTFDRLAKMGVNIVRMPINQDWALSDPAYRQNLDRAISEANSRGIYVVLDLHWHDGKQLPCLNSDSLRMWRQLASRYSKQAGVLYDIQNEPQWISWKSYEPWAEAAIANIRAVNPNSLCIVEGTQYASNLSGVLADPVKAPNVVYSVHEYGPSLKVPEAGPEFWDETFGDVASKYPVYVGEFGGNADDVAYGKQLIQYMDQKGLSWTSWNWGEAVPNLERGGQLTAFGQLVAAHLKTP